MQNKKIVFVIVGIIALAGAFYGGMVYGGNNVRASIASRGAAFNQNGGSGVMGGRNGGRGGMVNGKIIAKDATSITVEMRALQGGAQGATAATGTGSRIIFYTDKTTVAKTVDGTLADLAIGKDVNVIGTPNPDGSVNAQSVQLRIPLK